MKRFIRSALIFVIAVIAQAALGQPDFHFPVQMQNPGDPPQWVISNSYGGFPHYGALANALDFKHRNHYLYGNYEATYGRLVLSAAPGRIYDIGYSPLDYGNYVIIAHGEGWYTLYAHLNSVTGTIWEGKDVKLHEVLGGIGASGIPTRTNPHLHFEVRRTPYGESVRPEPLCGEGTFFQGYPVRHSHTGYNASSFVSDVTYPDGTVVPPNTLFTKVWRIRNTGTNSWYSAYKWVFVWGDRMQGTTNFLPAIDIPPGQTWDPAVTLRSPSSPGTYRGYWQMESPSGQRFGTQVWVEIRVLGGAIYAYDEGPYFQLFGPPQWWWRDNNVGLNGMYYTYTNGATVSNYAQWRPPLPTSGRYRVEVMIPEQHATTRSARYEVNHRNGRTVVTVNQSIYFREWVSLGEFDFNAGTSGFVQLTDVTGEPYSWYLIGFDAMRFIPV